MRTKLQYISKYDAKLNWRFTKKMCMGVDVFTLRAKDLHM